MTETQPPFSELVHRLSYQEYASAPGLRSGWLQEIRKSPAHLKESITNPKPATEALILGQMIHTALEDPERFLTSAVVEPIFTGKTKDGRDSTRSAEAGKKRDEWRASVPETAIVVTQEEHDMIQGIIEKLTMHRLCRNLLRSGVRESSVWVKDPETGLVLKCRLDFIHDHGFLVDYKSTMNAAAWSFSSEIFSERKRFYILNLAHYVHCLRVAGIGRKDEATIIAIEKPRPHGINVFPLDQGMLDMGERWRASLTRRYAECLEKDVWPCYDEAAVQVTIPNYARYPEDEETQ